MGEIILQHTCLGECLWVPTMTKERRVCQIFLKSFNKKRKKKKKNEGEVEMAWKQAMIIHRNGANVRESCGLFGLWENSRCSCSHQQELLY